MGLGLLLALLVTGCSDDDGRALGDEGLARVEQPISGSNAQVDNTGFSWPWIPAVGQLQMNGKCTGTLVAPSVVLSAGHCFDGNPAQNPGQFVIPTGPPVGNAPSGPQFPVQSWKRITGAAPDAHDVACAFLATPVPKTLVASYPRVFTGGINNAWAKKKIKFPAFIAGFGSFVTSIKQTSTLADGNRRWGAAPSDLGPYYDECGDPNEGHCFNDWVWDAARNANPQTERGDSGGPLVMTGATGPTIVGVYSGYWWDGFPHDDVKHSVWAPTGDPDGTNNGLWIVNNCLGADADGDGVPDALDNCPASRCASSETLDPEDCVNPDQLDSDGDGVGEACDNCSKVVCDSMVAAGGIPPHVTCFNPGQSDLDWDSRGDACDLCPNSEAGAPAFETSTQSDVDHDGIGDTCDFCENPDPYAACANSSFCFKSVCLIEPGAAFGYCASPTDSDSDGIADGCDQCPGYQTPLQENSNLLAEEREKKLNPTVKNLADACDPVPIVRVEAQKAIEITLGTNGGYTPGDGVGPDDVADINQNGWLGVDIASPASKTVQRQVAYRHCSCVVNGTELKLANCTAPNGPCPIDDPLGAPLKWSTITLTESSGAAYTDAFGLTSPKGFTTSQLSPGIPGVVRWPWRSDVLAGKVAGLGTCPGTGVLDCRTHGVVFTGTQKVAPYASTREQNHVLGDVFAVLDTPGLKPVLPKEGLICPAPCTPEHWGFPDYLLDPDPFGFTGLLARPTPLLIDPTGGIVAATSPGSGIDVTSYFDSASAALLQGNPLWLGAVEPIGMARYSSSTTVRTGIRAVAMDREFTGRAPVGIAMTSTGVTVAGRVSDDVIAAALGPSDEPPALQGIRAAFSAVEGSVYMVGGRLPGGAAAGTVWEWSLDLRRWSLARVAPPVPSANMLSVGYAPDGQHLYVLDVDDNDSIGPTLKFARLYRMDLATGTSTRLLRVPYLGKWFAAIAVMPDGLLALVSSSNQTHTVWRIDGRGQSAQFKGVFTAKGRARSGPVMGEDRLYLAVESAPGLLEVVDLSAERFHGGPPCKSL